MHRLGSRSIYRKFKILYVDRTMGYDLITNYLRRSKYQTPNIIFLISIKIWFTIGRVVCTVSWNMIIDALRHVIMLQRGLLDTFGFDCDKLCDLAIKGHNSIYPLPNMDRYLKYATQHFKLPPQLPDISKKHNLEVLPSLDT